jgi:hypothetical protein
MTDTWRPTIHADIAMLVEPSSAAVPCGPLLHNEIHRARGNHDHNPRTDGTPRIWGARGFRFSITAPPFHRLVPMMCGAWAHLLAPGYAERAVWARSAAPNGLPLTGEDK